MSDRTKISYAIKDGVTLGTTLGVAIWAIRGSDWITAAILLGFAIKFFAIDYEREIQYCVHGIRARIQRRR